ncbi:MAG: PaREP1 family protein [archaeon YNP-LCB-003-016]|uniref:PaREP1 family protein n=1 Tax=Candidatus Culexarchaeum yellowstonense TaxID=2928963 RepID=UPI0026ED1E6E|nr:PaREP1 family protein [Candidatus Culexarchaeum yellowstonense]MCR6693081.1 PaREP1 family protein [Candidatus Culexarchaeum yellowstonense]
MSIIIPKRLLEELRRKGFDAEPLIIDLLAKSLNLDPKIVVDSHIELALRYFEEGMNFIDKDPVQASEKLYKAAEETVKALTVHFNLNDILEAVEKRGRWTATELDKAVRMISQKLGRWFVSSWDAAWTLHVWGFHEAKLDSESIKERVTEIEKMITEARKITTKE